MRVLIVSASRYGSTLEIARWIAERLRYEGLKIEIISPDKEANIDNYDLVILGSGIYEGKVLPKLEEFIEKYKEKLESKKLALFGVCIEVRPIFYKGITHGGINYLRPIIKRFPKNIIHADMLSGEMVPQKMKEGDKEKLRKFYKAIMKLNDREIEERMRPKTFMNKTECWNYAEKVLKRLNES